MGFQCQIKASLNQHHSSELLLQNNSLSSITSCVIEYYEKMQLQNAYWMLAVCCKPSFTSKVFEHTELKMLFELTSAAGGYEAPNCPYKSGGWIPPSHRVHSNKKIKGCMEEGWQGWDMQHRQLCNHRDGFLHGVEVGRGRPKLPERGNTNSHPYHRYQHQSCCFPSSVPTGKPKPTVYRLAKTRL